jgi:AraC-like DNA-binding protein
MSSPELPVHDARPFRRIVSTHRPYLIPADHKADEPHFDCFTPPTKLYESIAYLWVLSCRDPQHSTVELVSPDVGIELIYRLGNAGEMLVRGPQRRLTTISIDPLASYVGVRIRPAIAQQLTGFSVAELLDRRLPTAPINSELADQLHEAVSSRSKHRALLALAALLSQHLVGSGSADIGIASMAARLIGRSNGTVPIRDIARRVGCSERHLRRVLITATGLSPKEHACIARFKRAMHLVARTSGSLAEIALDLAYTDQPHMTREFVKFAGQTPRSLRRVMSAFDKKSSPQSQ